MRPPTQLQMRPAGLCFSYIITCELPAMSCVLLLPARVFKDVLTAAVRIGNRATQSQLLVLTADINFPAMHQGLWLELGTLSLVPSSLSGSLAWSLRSRLVHLM